MTTAAMKPTANRTAATTIGAKELSTDDPDCSKMNTMYWVKAFIPPNSARIMSRPTRVKGRKNRGLAKVWSRLLLEDSSSFSLDTLFLAKIASNS